MSPGEEVRLGFCPTGVGVPERGLQHISGVESLTRQLLQMDFPLTSP